MLPRSGHLPAREARGRGVRDQFGLTGPAAVEGRLTGAGGGPRPQQSRAVNGPQHDPGQRRRTAKGPVQMDLAERHKSRPYGSLSPGCTHQLAASLEIGSRYQTAETATMIVIGRASSTARFTGTGSQRQAAAPAGQSPAAGGMAREPGGTGSPVPQRSACRRVAVIVDGSPESAPALRQAAAQARQRNATLDVISVVQAEADARAVTMARVQLGELSRRACPYGVGAPVRFRVEHGDLDTLLRVIRADVELLVAGPGMMADEDAPGPAAAPPAPQAARPQTARTRARGPRAHSAWLHTLLHVTS